MAKKEPASKTNAARILDAAGIHYELREYEVDENDLSAPHVAEMIGMPAEVAGREAGLLTLQVGEARLQCVDSGETGPVYACIHAEDVAITREAGISSARNRLAGQVRSVTVEGALARIELDCGFPLVARVTAQSAGELALREGEQVAAVVKATAVHLAAYSKPSPR